MRIVAALGGNALVRRGEPLDADTQIANVRRAAAALAEIAEEHALVVTHGNGPQIGFLAEGTPSLPLDVLGAESEGMIGYWIEQELDNCLGDRDVATLLTRVEVDPDDRAFREPSKPIGPVYPANERERLERERGWSMASEQAGGVRRVVASPRPQRILELRTIELLVRLGVLVVCGGGGGIPVVRDVAGGMHGVEAVIDKDRFAERLAAQLDADLLLLLTDVPAVFLDWPEPRRRAVRRAPPRALTGLDFEAGTMAPKIEAARHFAQRPGAAAAIGALDDAARVVRGEAGTWISGHVRTLEEEELASS